MSIRNSQSAWLRRTFGLLACLTALCNADLARAQAPGGGDSGKHYTKELGFNLPISIEEAGRGKIREVQLFLKSSGGDWQKAQSAPPTQPHFKFKAPQDGEYWFTLVTIDNNSKAMPSDLTKLLPADIVKVVVDTQAPAFDLQPIKIASGEQMLRCTVTDANPDYRALKLTYRGNDQMVHVLEAMPGQQGMFRVPSPDVLLNPIHAVVTDLAGNSTVKDITLQESVAVAPPPVTAPQPTVPVQTVQPVQAVQIPQETVKPTVTQAVNIQPQTPQSTGVVQGGGTFVAQGTPTVVQTNSIVATPVQQPIQVDSKQTMPGSPGSTPATLPPSLNRQLINTTRASLDYRIDQVGPSGVGKIEVWMTTDQGSNWKRLCEDADRRSPAEFDLPGDGLYGLRVVVTNGNGFGGRPPAPGEQPQCWIEVDTQAPFVVVKELEPVSNGSTIDIRWQVTDKNLSSEPINLYYATRKEGPWQPVARNLKNDGMYRWQFPRDAGTQFYVRVEVVDMAGNLAHGESPTAMALDMTEPRATVVGVTGVNGQPGTSRGN